MYAVLVGAKAAVAGAPQYFIGKYLNKEHHLPILYGITASNDEAHVRALDDILHDTFVAHCNDACKPDIYLHYSPLEQTYEKQIVYMIEDLQKLGYNVEKDNNYTYTKHADVGTYFIAYLQKQCRSLLNVK